MRFLFDENFDLRLRPYLTALGHDVTAIATDYPRAISDPAILSIAQAEQRILITNDRDFGSLVFREGQPHAGIMHFRLRSTAFALKRNRLDYVPAHYGDRLDQYLLVTDHNVRVRRSATT